MRILQKIKEIDVKTSHFFPQFYHHRFFSGAMKFIAGIGDFGMIWLVLILLLSLNDKTQLLSQKMLAGLVQRIDIFEEKRVRITLKFQDGYHLLTDHLTERAHSREKVAG